MTSTLYPLSVSPVASFGSPDVYSTAYGCVVDGDDVSANASQWSQQYLAVNGGVPALTFANFLFGSNSLYSCVAVAGEKIATMVTNAPANVDSKVAGGKTNWAVLASTYSADVAASVTTSAIGTSASSWGTGRKTAGFAKLVLVAPPPTLANSASWSAICGLFKSSFVSYGFDQYVDLAADAVFGAANIWLDRRWYLTDSMTLTPNGVIRYTDLVLTQVKAALGL